MKYSRKEHEQYLNDISSDISEENFVMAGKYRIHNNNYGTLLRKYDPIAFSASYNDRRRDYEEA